MSKVALYRKWRPLTLSDVAGQTHITRALSSQLQAGRVSHAYLFTGTRGTGKTTCAKILARAANCLDLQGGDPCNKCKNCMACLNESALDVSEIDAASNNGVDNIRDMREEAFLAPTALKYRVYIIDEVHMLSTGAFNALLKILEEPPEHVIFILATTELHKVPATILSRCQRYDFRRIAPEIIAARLEYIAQTEGASLSGEGAKLLAALGDGSMRDAVSLLDRCMDGGEITPQTIEAALGLAPREAVTQLLDALIAADAARALTIFEGCYMDGRDIVSLMDELLTVVRDVYVAKATGAAHPLAEKLDAGLLEYLTACLCDLLRRFTRTAMRRADAEMCLLRMCLRGQKAEKPPLPPEKPTASGDDLPWETPPVSPPKAEQTPKASAPKRQPSSAPAQSSAELEGLVKMVSPSVNSAVRTYLSLAQCENIDNILNIFVAEESVGFMLKPAVIEAVEKAALALGHKGAIIKGPQKSGGPPGATDILSRAKSLGINKS